MGRYIRGQSMTQVTDERVLLDPRTDRDDIDDAMVRCGWQLVDIVAATETEPYQLLYATCDGRGWLRLVDDARLGVAYVQATGPGAATALDQVRESLATVTLDRVWEQLRADHAEARRQGLCWLAAAGLGEPEPRSVAVVCSALHSDDASVREAALLATAYLRWPAFERELAKRAEVEPIEALQRTARALLDAWPREAQSAAGGSGSEVRQERDP